MQRHVIGMALCLLAATDSCDRAPPDRRPWRASDHDRTDESATGAVRTPPVASARPDQPDALVETMWRQQCAICHGLTGRGDGQQGAMVGAADLSRPDWQANTSDAEIASIITGGRGRMPRFDLPPAVVSGLVQRIRNLKRR